MKIRMLIFSLFVLLSIQMSAQKFPIVPNAPESTLIKENAAAYQDATQVFSSLYYGKEEERLPFNLTTPYLRPIDVENRMNNDFFEDTNKNAYTEGELFYDGVFYPKVTLRLDLFLNRLIVLTPNRTNNVVLEGHKLGYADVSGYRVVFLEPDGAKNHPGEGYYMRFSDGQYPVYKKYIYKLQRTPSETRLILTIRHYVYKDGVYHAIKNKGGILKVFKLKKKELEKFIEDHNLSFENDLIKGSSFAKVAKQFENLNK